MASRFSCSICLDDFTKPKLIDCHHTFCEKCLADHIRSFSRNNQFQCPLCRRDISVPDEGVSGFSSNFYLEETLLESGSTMPSSSSQEETNKCDICDSKKKEVHAAFHCKDCKQFLCAECKTTHDSFSGCFNHVVLPIDEVNMFSPEKVTKKKNQTIFCPQHPKDALEFFCQSCQLTLCYKCSATVHSGHDIIEIDDELKLKATNDVRTLLHDLELMKTPIKEYAESLQFSLSNIQLSTIGVCQKLDDHIATVCREIQSFGETMKSEILKTNDQGEAILDKTLTKTKTVLSDVDESLQKASQILENDSAVRIVNVLPKLQQQALQSSQFKFIIPETKKNFFHKGCLNAEAIYQLLGNLEHKNISEIQVSFNLDALRDKGSITSKEFLIRNNIRCSMTIDLSNDIISATILTNRQPMSNGGYPHPVVPQISCSFIVELINFDSNSSLMTRLDSFSSMESQIMNCFKWSKILDWKTLSNPDSGFSDKNGNIIFRSVAVYKK